MHNLKIIFFKINDNKCPVKEFLDSLNYKELVDISKVLKAISEIEDLPRYYFKKLKGTNDIWECRIKYNKKYIRILGFFYNQSSLILTNGFFKKDKRIPINEIKKAENYKKEYIKRISNGWSGKIYKQ